MLESRIQPRERMVVGRAGLFPTPDMPMTQAQRMTAVGLVDHNQANKLSPKQISGRVQSNTLRGFELRQVMFMSIPSAEPAIRNNAKCELFTNGASPVGIKRKGRSRVRDASPEKIE